MRYLLIDRIERLECNKEIVAIKNVALSEDVYSDHFLGAPVMPGALLIESLAQAGTALLEVSAHHEKTALLVIVDKAKFRTLIRPGDQLVVTAALRSLESEYAQIEGTVHVAGRLAMSAQLTFAIRDAGEFYSPRVRFLVEALYAAWLRGATLVGIGEAAKDAEEPDA